MPGLEMFTLNWPQLAVRSSSVKLPRWSVFIFKGKQTASSGKYERYVE